MKKILLAACAVLMTTGLAGAQLASNAITATNPSADNPFTSGQVVAANLTFSGIGRGSGINANAGADRYNASSWNTPALDTTAYFTFTLTPDAGYQINFTSFTYTGQASGTGLTSFAFRSSVDGFTANIGTATVSGTTLALSGDSYQSIDEAIEFRLYGWGASASTGTGSVNSFSFDGTVTAVPEPHEYALGLMGLMAIVAYVRRRRQLA